MKFLSDLDSIPYLEIESMLSIDQPLMDYQASDRIFILGPGGSGKDTLAVSLSNYIRFNARPIVYKGSTSLAMLREVYAMAIRLTKGTGLELLEQYEFYARRSECRTFWFNVIKAYAEHDRTYMLRAMDSEFHVGSRNWDEIKEVYSYSNKSVFILCAGEPERTWKWSTSEAMQKIYEDFKAIPHIFYYDDSPFTLISEILKVATFINDKLELGGYKVGKQDVENSRHGVYFGHVIADRWES